jgi:hypothetical protein
MPLPYQGTPGVYDTRNPTLLPQFYKPVQQGATISMHSPAGYAKLLPRAAASLTVTVGGTVASGNVSTITVTQAQLTTGVITASYTAGASDGTTQVAEGLASALQTLFYANSIDGIVTASESVITINWNGPTGNYAVVTVAPGALITLTRNPSSGKMAGGSGPVYAANNFNFTYNNVVMSFFYGQPYSLGLDLVAVLIAADMPVV